MKSCLSYRNLPKIPSCVTVTFCLQLVIGKRLMQQDFYEIHDKQKEKVARVQLTRTGRRKCSNDLYHCIHGWWEQSYGPTAIVRRYSCRPFLVPTIKRTKKGAFETWTFTRYVQYCICDRAYQRLHIDQFASFIFFKSKWALKWM